MATSVPGPRTDEQEVSAVPVGPTAPRRRLRVSAPMLTFLGRRLISSAIVLLGATFIVYMLLAVALDPLEDLQTSSAPNKAQLIASRIQLLDLNTPAPVRWLKWVGGIAGCAIGKCDLGESWVTRQPVGSMLGSAIPSSVQLIGMATFLAIGLGITVGIASALRQYTGFDYGVTFMSFLLYSLPIFWVAVLLKLWGAIGFNDFLRDPHVSTPTIAGLSLVGGPLSQATAAREPADRGSRHVRVTQEVVEADGSPEFEQHGDPEDGQRVQQERHERHAVVEAGVLAQSRCDADGDAQADRQERRHADQLDARGDRRAEHRTDGLPGHPALAEVALADGAPGDPADPLQPAHRRGRVQVEELDARRDELRLVGCTGRLQVLERVERDGQQHVDDESRPQQHDRRGDQAAAEEREHGRADPQPSTGSGWADRDGRDFLLVGSRARH